MHLQIFDLDGSLTRQASLAGAAPWQSVRMFDFRDIGPKLRLWSRAATIETARRRIAESTSEPAVTLLGSGDFHHVAALLHERVREPFTLIHFDNHPDWVRLAPRWHCGSWLNRTLALPNLKRAITLGPCSDDLVIPGIKGGNLAALDSARLVLFPWHHAPSRVFHRIADGPGHRYEHGLIHWRNLNERRLDEAISAIMSEVPTEAVWITIDKDVLPEHELVTNWDQGHMPLDAVLRFVGALVAERRLIGADICGEYAPPVHANPLKRIEARMDQPHRDNVTAENLAANERVNRALLGALAGAAPC
ncbi:MAG TPA: arginase family protein [Rhodanobacteraceae bacterium]|nr:arginase family protein [Rhodanobacteraceae bacterium]